VGLNPAYQKSMQFGQLTVDAVNRADAIFFSAGGKGQHCTVAANLYAPGCAEVAQFLGDEGPAGVGASAPWATFAHEANVAAPR
jgi:fructose-1-phosphate kinase PfkB-like protein